MRKRLDFSSGSSSRGWASSTGLGASDYTRSFILNRNTISGSGDIVSSGGGDGGSSERFVSQVIYPAGRLEALTEHAFLIGWNSENFRCTICCAIVLPVNELHVLKEAIALCCSREQGLTSTLWSRCAPEMDHARAVPLVLGEWVPHAHAGHLPSAEQQRESIWITLSYTGCGVIDGQSNSNPSIDKQIRLHSLYSLGCRFDTSSCLFDYDPVRTNEYECLYTEREGSIFTANSNTLLGPMHSRDKFSDPAANINNSIHSSGSSHSHVNTFTTDLDIIITQLNTADEMQRIIEFYLHQIMQCPSEQESMHGSTAPMASVDSGSSSSGKSSSGNSSSGNSSSGNSSSGNSSSGNSSSGNSSSGNRSSSISGGSSAFSYYFNHIETVVLYTLAVVVWLWFHLLRLSHKILTRRYSWFSLGRQVAKWLGIGGATGIDSSTRASLHHQSGVQVASSADSSSSGSSSSTSGNGSGVGIASDAVDGIRDGLSCRDVSATAACLATRAALILRGVRKCGLFPHIWCFPPELKQSLWIDVNSLIALLIVDVTIGCCVGYFTLLHAREIVQWLTIAAKAAEDAMILRALEWFNHSPGGVKLNPLITANFGALLRLAIDSYDTLLVMSRPLHLPVIRLIACSGALGFSLQLVMIVDVIRLLTAHIALLHRALGQQHRQQLQMLYSMWLLFQGRKINVLRNRVDTLEYDSSLLLMGMMLFCIVVFLFPNSAAFFYLFALAQLGNVTVQSSLAALSVAIAEYPFFTLLLRILWPRVLTDGVLFEVVRLVNDNSAAATSSPGIQSCNRWFSGNTNRADDAAAATTNTAAAPFDNDGTYSQTGSGENFSLLKQSWRNLRRGVAACAVPTVLGCESICAQSDASLLDAASGRTDGVTISNNGQRRRSEKPSRRVSFHAVATEESAAAELQHHHFFHAGEEQHQHGTSSVSSATPVISSLKEAEGSSKTHIDSSSRQDSASLRGIRKSSSLNDTVSNSYNRSHQMFSQGLTALQRQNPPASAASVDATSMRIMARRIPWSKVFGGFFDYAAYCSARGLWMQVLRGALFGWPALDIQFIFAISDIADKRQLAELSRMSRVIRTIPSPRDAAEAQQFARVADFAIYEELQQFGYAPRVSYWDIIRSTCLVTAVGEGGGMVRNESSEGADLYWASANAVTSSAVAASRASWREDAAIGASGSESPLLPRPRQINRFENPRRRRDSRYLLLSVLAVLTANMLLYSCGLLLLFQPSLLPERQHFIHFNSHLQQPQQSQQPQQVQFPTSSISAFESLGQLALRRLSRTLTATLNMDGYDFGRHSNNCFISAAAPNDGGEIDTTSHSIRSVNIGSSNNNSSDGSRSSIR